MDRHRNIWLLFGTAPNRADTPAAGRFYALRDERDMSNGATLSEDSASIKDVTAGTPSGSRGWYIRLERGEKVVGAPNIFNGMVLFTTVTPDDGTCGGAGGTAKLYALHAWNGQAAIDFATGSALGTSTPTSRRFKDIGHGIPSVPLVLMTRPLVPGTPPAAVVMTSTANQEISTTAIPAPTYLKHVRSWRERVQ
jgi:type IV pilus assembly protein PilY1